MLSLNETNALMKYIYSFLIFFSLIGQGHAQYANLLNDTLNFTFQSKSNQYDLKGVTAAVAFPDGSIWTNTEGTYGSNDLDPDVLFEPGSITKSTIAAVILLLEEAGKLSINDSLYHYLSPIQNVSYGITLKQLLNHTNGLYNYTNHPDFLTFVNNGANWNTVIPIDSVLARYVDPPINNPGSNWSYCNTGFLLLGQVIEQVENKALNVVLDSLLFAPLELDDSYLAGYDTYPNDHAGYWLDATTHEPDVSISFLSGAWGAGGLVMTSSDVAKWGYDLFTGNVLSDSSYAKLIDYVDDGDDGYGLAVFRRYYRSREYIGHTGATLMQAKLSYSVDYDFSVSVISSDFGSYNSTRFIENAIIDAVNFHMDNYLSIDKLNTSEEVEVFPNPSTNHIRIQSLSAYQTLHVLDLNGSKKKSINITQDYVEINKADLGAGVYILQLIQENGTIVRKKIIFI